MNTEKTTYSTNYYVAAHWLRNALILCNEIYELDPSIIDNAQFPWTYYEDEDGNTYDDYDDIPEDVEAEEHSVDIFQYFLTNCTESDVQYLERTFGLKFTYSDMLNLFVLCVDHFGTNWRYVHCDTTNENAAAEEGETLDR